MLVFVEDGEDLGVGEGIRLGAGDGDGDGVGVGVGVGEIFCDADCVDAVSGDVAGPFRLKLLTEFNKMNPKLRSATGIRIKIGIKPFFVPTIKV